MNDATMCKRFMQAWGGHLRLARISNLPTIFTNVWAGAALAGIWDRGSAALLSVAILSLALALFYTAGMYLNDYLDYHVDCKERPERPLPRGTISRSSALGCIIGYFVIGLVLLAVVRPVALIPGGGLVGVIVWYDCWHKNNCYSHWIMALARALVYVTTFVALGGSNLVLLLGASVWMLLYVAGLTYIARSETRPDLLRYWPSALLVLPALYFGWQATDGWRWVSVMFLVWCGWSLSFVYRRVNKSIGGGIERFIAGIALLDAMVLASGGFSLLVYAAIGMFVLTRGLQRYIAGS